MCKSVAILLLIIAFVGAEDNQAGQASSTSIPTGGAGAEDVSEGSKMTPKPAEDTHTQRQKLDNTHESVSEKEDQEGVEAQKEDHAHDSKKEREAIEIKMNGRTGEEEEQAGEADITSTSSGDTENKRTGSEDSASSTATSDTETQQNDAVNPPESVPNEKDEAEMNTLIDRRIESLNKETEALMNKIKDDTDEKNELSMQCLDCLCTFATDCDLERQCEEPISTSGLGDGFEKGDCGPFHISFPFWADANNVKMDLGDANMENEWRRCSLDLMCSKESIQKYFHKYHHDCNRDGKVDCVDYAAIHTLGPYGCMKPKNLLIWNMNRRKGLLECLASEEEGPYAKKMEELNAKLKLQDIGAWKLADIEQKSVKAKVQTNTVNPQGKTNAKEADAHEDIQYYTIKE